jgi:hypothetical protein
MDAFRHLALLQPYSLATSCMHLLLFVCMCVRVHRRIRGGILVGVYGREYQGGRGSGEDKAAAWIEILGTCLLAPIRTRDVKTDRLTHQRTCTLANPSSRGVPMCSELVRILARALVCRWMVSARRT